MFRSVDRDGSGSVSFFELIPVLASLYASNPTYGRYWSSY